jgi:hypothetical protein
MRVLEFYIHRRTSLDDSRSGTVATGASRLELTLPIGATVSQDGQELVIALPDDQVEDTPTLIHLHEEPAV